MTPEEILAKHRPQERRVLCGAQAWSEHGVPHHFSTSIQPQMMTCTLPPDHEPELHKDGICCYAGHRFAEATSWQDQRPTVRCVEDGQPWPCDVVAIEMVRRYEALPEIQHIRKKVDQ